MGTTNRRGIAQKISKDSMRGKDQFKRKVSKFVRTKFTAFRKISFMFSAIAAFFGGGLRGGMENHIVVKEPTIPCACGCGKYSFAATYYNLTHAVLHKRELSNQ